MVYSVLSGSHCLYELFSWVQLNEVWNKAQNKYCKCSHKHWIRSFIHSAFLCAIMVLAFIIGEQSEELTDVLAKANRQVGNRNLNWILQREWGNKSERGKKKQKTDLLQCGKQRWRGLTSKTFTGADNVFSWKEQSELKRMVDFPLKRLHCRCTHWQQQKLLDKQLLLKVTINDIFGFLYVGETFTDVAVTALVYCAAFPSDRLSECHQWFDAAGLTAAPKTPNKHVLAALERPETAE